jgi:hypothetical protein
MKHLEVETFSHIENGSFLPISCSDHTSFPNPTQPLHLPNVLVSPQLVTNLIFVRKFTKDNNCSVEFDPFGLSVKE